ncbi:MAG TPA: family 10 glycosylhydrolase [Phycisphaeraceae bacterium]
MMNRVAVLTLVLASGALGAEQTQWASDTFAIWPLLNERPNQTAVVSWSDWLVFDHAEFETPGVRFIINKMAASGIRTLWWRTFGGGWALYSSQVDGVTTGNYAGQGADYSQYDSLADAVEYAHKLGLKVYAWYTPLEEAHAWPDNVRSHYVDAHKDQWDVKASGAPAGAPSFYFADYRRYKAELAREMVTRYQVDGLVIDFGRRGAPGRSDQWGYLPQILSAFKRETGLDARELPSDDPRWQRFRARYVGLFMQEVRRAIDGLDRDVELVMMFPANRPLTAHWDAQGWADLVDRFVLVAHGREGWGWMTDQAQRWREQYQGLGKPLSITLYTLRGDTELNRKRAEAALAAGFDDLIWFETTYLHFRDLYSLPRSLACPERATLQSPAVDLTGGGQVRVLAAGDWVLGIDGLDEPIAQGHREDVTVVDLPYRAGDHRLVIRCTLPEGSPRAGVAAQGWAVGRDGQRRAIHTDEDWTSLDADAGEVVTIAQPGIPPLLGEHLKDDQESAR